MKIVISGATGLVGTALVQNLKGRGHSITCLVRRQTVQDKEISWDPTTGSIDKSKLEGHDVVVHLAGKNISSERWSPAVKAELIKSRVKGTRLLSETLSSLSKPPGVLISASAIGIYGCRDNEVLSEDSEPAMDFLADLCKQWEAATEPAMTKGIRTVNLRIGVVLSTAGGALAKMLIPFKLGLGGQIGSGKQYMSWIDLDDLCGIVNHVLARDELAGPVNAVAPGPVTNAEFTACLAAVLKRPAIFPMPAFAARLAFGEMADALLLSSQKVKPAKLIASGYPFLYPDLQLALNHLL